MDEERDTLKPDEQQTNSDDGEPGTLEKPREHDEGGEETDDTIPDA